MLVHNVMTADVAFLIEITIKNLYIIQKYSYFFGIISMIYFKM